MRKPKYSTFSVRIARVRSMVCIWICWDCLRSQNPHFPTYLDILVVLLTFYRHSTLALNMFHLITGYLHQLMNLIR